MRKFEIEGHEPSLLPENADWKLAWQDEFDGTELDETKWGYRLNFWGKRFAPFIGAEGIEVDGKSHLIMKLVEKDGEYCGCQLQTGALTFDNSRDPEEEFWPFGQLEKPKFMHGFGFYECRCKLNKNAGWWTAFWIQSPCIGAHPDPRFAGIECDIMESQEYAVDGTIRCGNIWNGYGKSMILPGHSHPVVPKTADDWHRFAVDWSPDGYVFYIDGVEVKRENTAVSQIEQFILLTTEPMSYRMNGKADPRLKNAMPDAFVVDYVRVFDRVRK